MKIAAESPKWTAFGPRERLVELREAVQRGAPARTPPRRRGRHRRHILEQRRCDQPALGIRAHAAAQQSAPSALPRSIAASTSSNCVCDYKRPDLDRGSSGSPTLPRAIRSSRAVPEGVVDAALHVDPSCRSALLARRPEGARVGRLRRSPRSASAHAISGLWPPSSSCTRRPARGGALAHRVAGRDRAGEGERPHPRVARRAPHRPSHPGRMSTFSTPGGRPAWAKHRARCSPISGAS